MSYTLQEIREDVRGLLTKMGLVLPSGDTEWQDWTPTFTNYVKGTGATVVARYRIIAGMVEAEFKWVLGTSFTMSSSGTISLPVEADDTHINTVQQTPFVGYGVIRDIGSSTFPAHAWFITSTTVRLGTWDAAHASGFLRNNSLAATLPMTWVAGDFVHLFLRYPPA